MSPTPRTVGAPPTPDETDELVAFVRARLDDTERVARLASEDRLGTTWWDSDWSTLDVAPLRHVRRHSPDRVLEDVAARRLIVEMAAGAAHAVRRVAGRGDLDAETVARAAHVIAHAAVLALARPHALHVDYQARWAR